MSHDVAAVEIDRLALKLSGLSEHEGHVLVWKIREALAMAFPTISQNTRIEGMKIGIDRQSGESMDSLSRRIVADLLSQLAQTG